MNGPQLMPWQGRPIPTLWLDVDNGRTIAGSQLVQLPRPVTLAAVLRAAQLCKVERVMLTGNVPARAWYLEHVDGWQHGAHYLDHDLPVGRYRHTAAGVTVQVRRAAEWFGAGSYGPSRAIAAWDLLEAIYRRTFRTEGHLLHSPGRTGREAWLLSVPRDRETGQHRWPGQLSPDHAELVRSTSPQHRIQLVSPADAEPMRSAWYLDGRWMYAALCRELGTGPARQLTAEEAREFWHAPRGRFARARYRVRFAAPPDWGTVGLFMVKTDDDAAHQGWTFPLRGETWADAAELELADRMGWRLDILEALIFAPGRPLDTWAKRLTEAREKVSDDEHGAQVAGMVRTALRAMLLHAIGGWHSTGRDVVTLTNSPMRRPAGDGWGTPDKVADGSFLWRRRTALSGRDQLMHHPEWSSQVWGRAHARILESPTAVAGIKAGALYVRPGSLVAIYGDALLLAEKPAWAGPGHDDGRAGRLRIKGHLCGPIPWPTRAAERDDITRAAGAAGDVCLEGLCP